MSTTNEVGRTPTRQSRERRQGTPGRTTTLARSPKHRVERLGTAADSDLSYAYLNLVLADAASASADDVIPDGRPEPV